MEGKPGDHLSSWGEGDGGGGGGAPTRSHPREDTLNVGVNDTGEEVAREKRDIWGIITPSGACRPASRASPTASG